MKYLKLRYKIWATTRTLARKETAMGYILLDYYYECLLDEERH